MATLGFERNITYALLSVPHLTGFGIVFATCWYADRLKQRSWWIVGTLFVYIIGIAILGGTMNVGAQMFASIIMVSEITPASNMNLAWIGNSAPPQKR